MSEEIIVTCPACNTQFYAPSEYCGGIVDCTECGTDFEIQAPPEKVEEKTKSGNNGQLDYDETILMSRSDIGGMIPKLKDFEI